MPNVKKISLPWSETGKTVYAIIRRELDTFCLDDADGSFAAAPADPYLSLAEDGTIKGLYEVSESRAAWNDGNYLIVIYRQSGAGPVPASDQIIGGSFPTISSDTEVNNFYDGLIESTLTFRQIVKIMLAALAGKSSGGGTATIVFRDVADTKPRITATADANGNRSAVTLDGA